jgi:heme/copper-type cytochrome/quinol oxidase subunit 2
MDWSIFRDSKVMQTLICAIMVFLSEPLFACAVCGTSQEESKTAFIVTTALLTFIPLILIATFVYFLVKKSKANGPAEEK